MADFRADRERVTVVYHDQLKRINSTRRIRSRAMLNILESI